MIGKLTFKLPEEKTEFELALISKNMACAIDDIVCLFEDLLKYESHKYNPDEIHLLEHLNTTIIEILEHNGAKL